MTIAIFAADLPTGEILARLLQRVDLVANVLRAPRHRRDIDERRAVIQPDLEDQRTTMTLSISPSLAAWLTRDPAANQRVLGTGDVPVPEAAATWLGSLRMPGDRAYSATLDGRALAEILDLELLAEFSPDFRALIDTLRPGWSTSARRRGRGRPPGVALFRGTGYELCVELLHRGEGTEVSIGELVAALQRTKTPVLRFVRECERRGYLQRTSARGPLRIRNASRLVDDMVAATRARLIDRPPRTLALSADRDPAGLAKRLAARLSAQGRILAVTGAPAVEAIGGDLLIGGGVRAYARLDGIEPLLGDAYPDARAPRLIVVDACDESMLHRARAGVPAMVSPWQAVIDLLTSESEREREVGTVVRQRLEEGR